jgi:hypothetical protein
MIYLLGDTHSLDFVGLLEWFEVENGTLIHVGDAGEGFANKWIDMEYLQALQDYCAAHSLKILFCRGNHSNPAFYKPGHWSCGYSNLEFVIDYSVREIDGKSFLFTGGAISIDRTVRSEGLDYWADEGFVLNLDVPKVDYLITHSAGISQNPIGGLERIKYWLDKDPALKEELIKERKEIQKLYYHLRGGLKGHFYGHFHAAMLDYDGERPVRCLNINELIKL